MAKQMNYETSQALNPQEFKRYIGAQRLAFNHMLKTLNKQRLLAPSSGHPPKLALADQVLVALQYWREYRIYFHIAID